MAYIPVAAWGIIESNTAAAFFSIDSGSADHYIASFAGTTPNFQSITTLTNGGLLIKFVCQHTNTTASDLTVMGPSGSLGTFPLTKQGSTPLVAADIPNLAASVLTTGQVALARGGTNADDQRRAGLASS